MKKYPRHLISTVVAITFLLILGISVIINLKNSLELRAILEESVKSQLISISAAAREIIDVDEFISYESADAVEEDAYKQTLFRLRQLCDSVGAEYIYALKPVGDEYHFIFDTDTESEEVFIPYDLSPVHELAFEGIDAADIMNVADEYGSFNTGAVPIWKNGRVVGIISTDIADSYLKESIQTTTMNSVILVLVLAAAMGAVFLLILNLTKRVRMMQEHLEHLAHYDTVTGLPNRKCLLDHLSERSGRDKQPYALLFIDLDNFKRVNDTAGHDAGDELLKHIASFLEGAGDNSVAFRPTSGKLNIAARIGGDEFIQVISGVHSEEEAAKIGGKLMEDFTKNTYDRYIEKYGVGLSVGIALHPYHSDNYHVLIKYADIAMYHAKKSGKNQFKIYNDEMEQKPEK